jgi:hypothetical protein
MSLKVGVALWAVVSLAACGGGGTTGPSGGSGPVLSVGGDYAMAVELTENSCGPVTVLPLATRVAHTPGALQFQLTHGPNTYSGTFDAPTGGQFRTAARTFSDAASSQTVHIQGRFVATGLEAVVTVDQTSPAPACRYLVRWTGTKTGAPNVVP